MKLASCLTHGMLWSIQKIDTNYEPLFLLICDVVPQNQIEWICILVALVTITGIVLFRSNWCPNILSIHWNSFDEQLHVDLIHGPTILSQTSCSYWQSLKASKLPAQFQCLNSLGPSDAIWRWRSWSRLVQVMACCLTAPSHYLNQSWLIISRVLWHSSEDINIRKFEDINQ